MELEKYLSSPQAFILHRLKYYTDTSIILPKGLETEKHQQAADMLCTLRPDIVVVTATKDRLSRLQEAHKILVDQQGRVNWAWLIVDNLSVDGTAEYFNTLKDDRILCVECKDRSGCAYPIRNFGLNIVSTAFWRFQGAEPWVLVVDSDDRLYDQHSLHELMEMDKSLYGRRHGVALAHGYSDTQIHYEDGTIEYVPNPRDTSSTFPQVESLAETFYKGLNILGGAFPIETLGWLRYPPEQSFEDGGFNEKLMLQAKKKGLVWLAKRQPVTVKHFHRESMSGINNSRGNISKVDKVGPYVVTGVRADIVRYYRALMDYFVRERL